MKDPRRLTPRQIAAVMNHQQQVWQSTPYARDVIKDCCHALANALGLDNDTRGNFLDQCEGKICTAKYRLAYPNIIEPRERS
jgi:hypothetical protein